MHSSDSYRAVSSKVGSCASIAIALHPLYDASLDHFAS